MRAVILDYDGTLHDSARLYIPAFRKGYKYLTDKGAMAYRDVPDEEIAGYLGCSPKEMWETFAPTVDENERDRAAHIIADEMQELAKNGLSELYSGTQEALRELCSEGFRLIFLSNCYHSYMEMHRRIHRLDRFFSGYYCSEDYDFAPKPEIFNYIKRDIPADGFIVVGDRAYDLETAFKNGLKSIGCTYGFCRPHELDRADILIGDVSQLPKAVKGLFDKQKIQGEF